MKVLLLHNIIGIVLLLLVSTTIDAFLHTGSHYYYYYCNYKFGYRTTITSMNYNRLISQQQQQQWQPPTRQMILNSNDNNSNNDTTTTVTTSTSTSPYSSSSTSASTSNSNWFNTTDIINRFIQPKIDDPGLPLSDVLITQIIAPTIQIIYIVVIRHGPSPTWIQPIFDTNMLYSTRGAYIAPTLIHGAALSSCWILGALASKAYERSSISPQQQKQKRQQQKQVAVVEWDYSQVIIAIIKSGAFAIGILVLATQLDILIEYKRYVQYGESDEINFRLLVAYVEVMNDIIFEAITIFIWRLFLAYQTERMNTTL